MNRDVLLGRDVWAGLLFIALGSFTIAHSRDYAMGTLTAMGPGYFPAILGGMMILFGVTMSLGAIVRRAEVRIHPPQVQKRDRYLRERALLRAAAGPHRLAHYGLLRIDDCLRRSAGLFAPVQFRFIRGSGRPLRTGIRSGY